MNLTNIVEKLRYTKNAIENIAHELINLGIIVNGKELNSWPQEISKHQCIDNVSFGDLSPHGALDYFPTPYQANAAIVESVPIFGNFTLIDDGVPEDN